MYVDESRAEEYQKAGHKKVEPKEEPKATPKKKPATKKK